MASKLTHKLIGLLFLSAILTSSAFGQEHTPEIVPADEHDSFSEGRLLADYPNIRIASDFQYFTTGSTALINYFKTQLIPAIISYYQAALKIKSPLTSPLKYTGSSICGYPTPTALAAGVNADLFVFISNQDDMAATTMAATTVCALTSGVKRPMVINIEVNMNQFSTATNSGSPLTHDFQLNTLMHEFMHGFAMTSYLYPYFIDSTGKTLKNHVQTLLVNGENRTVLNLAPLTAKLRTFYGCDLVPGVFMENDGGAHLERRYYQYEIMASGALLSSRITFITLGFLEGTGWYVPDYSYAEPYFMGQGEGCGYINDNCDANEFSEFCTGTGAGCDVFGAGGGSCTTDTKSEGCRYYISSSSNFCENPSGANYASLASKQVYGRGLGSRCFNGNLTTSKTAKVAQDTYCFTYECSGSGSSTVLKVNFGTSSFNCTQEGQKSISGYYGFVNCPDPVQFCTTIGKPFCPKGCVGQGTCVNGKCQCKSGFQGTNCAFTA